MKKKICALAMAGVLLGSGFGVPSYGSQNPWIIQASAETLEDAFVISDGVLTKYAGEDTVVQIPNTVTSIGRGAFKGNTIVEEVVIPDTVTSLELFCFEGCTNLKRVQMGSAVTSIESKSFYNCTSLNQVVIPKGVKKIAGMTFMGCTSLAEITLPEHLPEGIGANAFFGTPWLNKKLEDNNQLAIYDGCLFAHGLKEGVVTIPDTVSTCAIQLFAQSEITELVLPDTLEEIPAGFCYGASKLRLVRMGDGVKKIGEAAFEGCSSLGDVSLSTKLTALPEAVFASCTSLEEIKLPGSITSIGVRAFSSCTKLREIWLPEGMKKISRFGFSECNKLTKVVVPESVSYMDEEAFKNSKQVVIYGSQGSYAQTYAEKYGFAFLPKSQLEDVVTPGKTEEGKNDFRVPDLSGLSYCFENAREDFSYTSDYRIQLSAYQYIYGDSVYAGSLYDAYQKWGGSCFGMCASSVLLHAGNTEVKLKDFNSNANTVGNLNITDANQVLQLSVTKFIECMHVLQNDVSVQRALLENKDDLTKICQEVQKSQNAQGQPVVIGIYGPEGGHALVGYKVENNKLYVYDPNYSQKVRYIELTQRENGTYSDWCYYMNDLYEWKTGKEDCWISYIPYQVYRDVWEGRSSQPGIATNLLQLSVENASICDAAGNEIATVVDGNVSTARKDIYLIYKMETEGTNESKGVSLYLPVESYQIKNLEKNTETFSASMTNVNQGASVVTQSDEISFLVKDEEQINAVSCNATAGETYQMTLRSTLMGQTGKIEISGIGVKEQSVGISQKNGEVQISNCDSAMVDVNGTKKATYTIVSSSSEGGDVLYQGNFSPVSGNQKVMEGQNATYVFVPKTGYVLVDVLVDQKSIGAVSSYTLEQVSGNHEIVAVFTKYENNMVTLDEIPEQYHTGKPVKPKVVVKIGEHTLKENVEYSLFYQNNIKPGTGKVTVIGLGDYAAIEKTITFSIVASKGETYTVGDFQYMVTNAGKKTVAVYQLASKKKKKVTIPKSIKIGNCNYKITKICANAFRGGKKVKSISIKTKDLNKIGKKAFWGIHAKATIFVPAKKFKAYEKIMKKKGQKTMKIKKL